MRIILCVGLTVRSGTNYLGSLFSEVSSVSSVPTVQSHSEFPFFRDQIINGYDNWVMHFNRQMFSFHPLNRDKMASFYGKMFLDYLKVEYGIEKDIVFVKDPSLYNVERFYEFFPNGKLIILTRCAPDLIASSLKASLQIRDSQSILKKIKARLKYYSGYNMVSYSKAYNEHAKQLHFLRHALKGNFIEVKYEDLVERPSDKFGEILTYCDIEFDETLVKKVNEAKVIGSSYFGAKKYSQNWEKLNKTKNFNPIGRYESWGFFNRFIYNRIANNSNRKVGYDHQIRIFGK